MTPQQRVPSFTNKLHEVHRLRTPTLNVCLVGWEKEGDVARKREKAKGTTASRKWPNHFIICDVCISEMTRG